MLTKDSHPGYDNSMTTELAPSDHHDVDLREPTPPSRRGRINKHFGDALRVMVGLLQSDSDHIRFNAAKYLLDQAVGRAPQLEAGGTAAQTAADLAKAFRMGVERQGQIEAPDEERIVEVPVNENGVRVLGGDIAADSS